MTILDVNIGFDKDEGWVVGNKLTMTFEVLGKQAAEIESAEWVLALGEPPTADILITKILGDGIALVDPSEDRVNFNLIVPGIDSEELKGGEYFHRLNYVLVDDPDETTQAAQGHARLTSTV
jgi:hypothetical protein